MDDFEEFYRATRDRVLRTVAAATGDRRDLHDVVSDAYVRAYGRWSVLSTRPDPTGWVIVTAINRRRSLWRRHRREVLGPPPDQPAPDGTGAVLPARVRAAVAGLPRRQREVLAMRVLADLSGEQTATLLRISPATVHVHLHRALQELRRGLLPAAVADPSEPEVSRDGR